ncbi:hypothetical protein MMC12_007559 [Toensbergia leucococca]|nr:hypothetical protein [Toensbergia leucococca]
MRAVGITRRLTLSVSFLLQGLSIFVAAILVTVDAIPEQRSNSDLILIAIPLLAWQFGAQVATSRALGFSEIPTTVLTSVYNDLASDPELTAWNNPKRTRRAAAVVMVLVGGICGGWISRISDGFGVVLWVGGGIKLALAVLWLVYDEESAI